MILSDGTIRALLKSGKLQIAPLEDEQVQSASVDIRLAPTLRVFRNHTLECIDPYDMPKGLTEEVKVKQGEAFVLHPGEFVLGATMERFTLANDIVARVDGKSSLGRIGLLVHATAGFVDAGFGPGDLTLELSNVATLPVKLWPGMRVGQVSFMALDKPALRPYGHPDLGSKYQGQSGPVPSLYHKNTRQS